MIDAKIKEAILLYLVENKMNQREFAAKLDVTPQTVTNWLTGKAKSIQSGVMDRLQSLLKSSTTTIHADNNTGIIANNQSVIRQYIGLNTKSLISKVLKLDICPECKNKVIAILNE